MELPEYRERLEQLRHQAWEDGVPIELSTALGNALDVARRVERQATCKHARLDEKLGWDHHGEVELNTCLECGVTVIKK